MAKSRNTKKDIKKKAKQDKKHKKAWGLTKLSY